MLTGLEDVPWSKLTHAHGSAADVPGNLRALASPDPADWVPALDALRWSIVHQGTVYSSSAHAVPFLYELLASPGVRCRARILELLIALAHGASFLEVHGEPGGESPDPDALATELRWVEAAREAVLGGVPAVTALLADPDLGLRMAASCALGRWAPLLDDPELEASVGEALLAHARREGHPWAEASLVLALAPFADDGRFAQAMRDALETPEDSVRLAAALALARRPGAPEAALAELAAALEDLPAALELFATPSWIRAAHHPIARAGAGAPAPAPGQDVGAPEDLEFPWWDGGYELRLEILEALMRQERPERFEAGFLALIRQAGPFSHEELEVALRGLFPQGLVARLSRPQARAIELLVENPTLWATHTWPTGAALVAVGLPETRDELLELLGREPGPVERPEEALAILERLVRAEAGLGPAAALSDAAWSQVTTLRLRELGSDAFMPLLARCPRLEILEVGPWVTDAGVASLPAGLPLTELELDARVGDVGLLEARRFPSLRRVHAAGDAISVRGVNRLRVALPECQVTAATLDRAADAADRAFALERTAGHALARALTRLRRGGVSAGMIVLAFTTACELAAPAGLHAGYACPECGQAPLRAPCWTCDRCAEEFDTFLTEATCPACAQRFEHTACPCCFTAHPFDAWRTD